MGVFSEMSMEQEYGDSPASVNIVPAVPAEPETAPDTLIQVNGTPDGGRPCWRIWSGTTNF